MRIPEHEIAVSFSRSGGKGGQNVNKVSTRVEARWDINASRAFSHDQKTLIKEHLRGKVTLGGDLIVVCASERSQGQNRQEALARLQNLVQRALKRPKKRISTKPTRSSRLKRLDNKRKLSMKKSNRKNIFD